MNVRERELCVDRHRIHIPRIDRTGQAPVSEGDTRVENPQQWEQAIPSGALPGGPAKVCLKKEDAPSSGWAR